MNSKARTRLAEIIHDADCGCPLPEMEVYFPLVDKILKSPDVHTDPTAVIIELERHDVKAVA